MKRYHRPPRLPGLDRKARGSAQSRAGKWAHRNPEAERLRALDRAQVARLKSEGRNV